MDILEKIIARKVVQVAEAKKRVTEESLSARVAGISPPRDFLRAIEATIAEKKIAVIAEIKKASPSKGLIRENFHSAAIAKSYEKNGATCLSVLTDADFFQGSAADLRAARAAVHLPVLRKDFIIDAYQLYESRAMGADAVLLIAAILPLSTMQAFEKQAKELGLSVLVEVHNAEELALALQLETPLLGINNRNLKTFAVDINTSSQLAAHVPADRIVVSESGVSEPQDIQKLCGQGIYGFLIGESLMRAADPGAALKELLTAC